MGSGLQDKVQQLLDKFIADGVELGLQAAVYYQGELLVDVFAGVADARCGKLVAADTLFPCFSSGKAIVGTLAHILHEKGVVAYDRPLAEYWPGFDCNGKENITLRHALSHTAGMSCIPVGTTAADLCDWDVMCRKLAESTPNSTPGEKTQYHAITYSWMVGNPLCLLAGKSFVELFTEEIALPLGIENEMFFALPPKENMHARVAWLEDSPPSAEPSVESAIAEAIPQRFMPLGHCFNQKKVREACIPASNSLFTARALAKHYAGITGNGVGGVRLLRPQTLAAATTHKRAPGDAGDAGKFGLGYGLNKMVDGRGVAFGHGGHGGALGRGDSRHALGIALTKNKINAPAVDDGSVADQFSRLVYRELGIME